MSALWTWFREFWRHQGRASLSRILNDSHLKDQLFEQYGCLSFVLLKRGMGEIRHSTLFHVLSPVTHDSGMKKVYAFDWSNHGQVTSSFVGRGNPSLPRV
jgi:hypothetical protein